MSKTKTNLLSRLNGLVIPIGISIVASIFIVSGVVGAFSGSNADGIVIENVERFSISGGEGSLGGVYESNKQFFDGGFEARGDVSVEGASTSTLTIASSASAQGGQLIFKDLDGGGCSFLSMLDGSFTTGTVACP